MEIAQIEGNAMIQTLSRQREEGFNQVAKLAGTVAGLQAQLAEAKAEIVGHEKTIAKLEGHVGPITTTHDDTSYSKEKDFENNNGKSDAPISGEDTIYNTSSDPRLMKMPQGQTGDS